MRKTARKSLSLASLVLLGMVSASAQAASPGGCTGVAQYHNGRFLGYKLASSDPMVGTWTGARFANQVVNPVNNASAPNTGVATIAVNTTGGFEVSGWSRYGKGAFTKDNLDYGNVYCLAYGKAYSIVRNRWLSQGRIDVAILNAARETAVVKDTSPPSSPAASDHGMYLLTKVPTNINMIDFRRVIDDAVYY